MGTYHVTTDDGGVYEVTTDEPNLDSAPGYGMGALKDIANAGTEALSNPSSVANFIADSATNGISNTIFSRLLNTETGRDQIMGGLKGVARAGTDVLAAPADLAYRGGNYLLDKATGEQTDLSGSYPSDYRNQFLDYIAGGEGNKTTEQLTQLGGNIATIMANPSQAENIASKIPGLAKLAKSEGALGTLASIFGKGIGYGVEGAGQSILLDPKAEDLGDVALKGAALNAAIPTVFGLGRAGLDAVVPSRGAAKAGKQIAEELRTVLPGALTEAVTPAERAVNAANALEKTAQAKIEAAGDLFTNLPKDTAVLDDAIKATRSFAEQVDGPIAPGGRTGKIVDYIERLKPKDKVLDIPASAILDDTGQPIVAATQKVIPGGPATVPLTKVQNTLRDLRTVAEGAQGVDRAVLGKAKEEILAATKASVKPESWDAFEKARSTWAKVKNTYDKGAVGKVRKSVTTEGTGLDTFKKALLNDPKGARQLAKVMSPKELNNAQDLILSDLLERQPVGWARRVTQKVDSYEAIFGKEGTRKILDMVGRDGTIGSKLLKDNNGLMSLFARLASRIGGGAVVGGALGGNDGALAGALAGAGSAATKGFQVSRVQSLLMRAAAGSDEALKILNTPATKTTIDNTIGRLTNIVGTYLTKDTSDKKSTTLSQKELSPGYPYKSDKNKSLQSKIFGKGEDMPSDPATIKKIEAKIDADPVDATIYEMESSRNPLAKNTKSTASGAFQLINATQKAFGVTDPFDIEQNYGAYKKLREENETRFGSNPILLYSAHYLGATVLDKVLKGKTLTEDEQAQVNELEKKILPKFEALYKSKLKGTVEA